MQIAFKLVSSNSLASYVIPENKDMGVKDTSKQLRSVLQMSNCLLPKIHPAISPPLEPRCRGAFPCIHPSLSGVTADPQGSDPA